MKRNNLAMIRKANGMTALVLSHKTGIRENRIFRLEEERATPTVEERAKLADGLCVGIRVLWPDWEGAQP